MVKPNERSYGHWLEVMVIDTLKNQEDKLFKKIICGRIGRCIVDKKLLTLTQVQLYRGVRHRVSELVIEWCVRNWSIAIADEEIGIRNSR